jgi:hypothetical protein
MEARRKLVARRADLVGTDMIGCATSSAVSFSSLSILISGRCAIMSR